MANVWPYGYMRVALVLFACLLGVRARYDEDLAKALAVHSARAYSDKPGGCFGSSGLTVTRTFSKTYMGFGTFAYTAIDESIGGIVISFRGTTSAKQLIQEALTSVRPVPFWPDPSLQVNAFFYACEGLLYDAIKTELVALIKKYPRHQIYTTGHSLGGAVATLTLMHLVYDKVVSAGQVVHYTFGEPRVGDFKFATRFNQLTIDQAYRVVHYRDIVSHLPPCHTSLNSKLQIVCDGKTDAAQPLNWAYQHITEVWYQEAMPNVFDHSGGSYKICTGNPAGEDVGCSDGLLLKDSITDHTHYFTYRGQPFQLGGACAAKAAAGLNVTAVVRAPAQRPDEDQVEEDQPSASFNLTTLLK